MRPFEEEKLIERFIELWIRFSQLILYEGIHAILNILANTNYFWKSCMPNCVLYKDFAKVNPFHSNLFLIQRSTFLQIRQITYLTAKNVTRRSSIWKYGENNYVLLSHCYCAPLRLIFKSTLPPERQTSIPKYSSNNAHICTICYATRLDKRPNRMAFVRQFVRQNIQFHLIAMVGIEKKNQYASRQIEHIIRIYCFVLSSENKLYTRHDRAETSL